MAVTSNSKRDYFPKNLCKSVQIALANVISPAKEGIFAMESRKSVLRPSCQNMIKFECASVDGFHSRSFSDAAISTKCQVPVEKWQQHCREWFRVQDASVSNTLSSPHFTHPYPLKDSLSHNKDLLMLFLSVTAAIDRVLLLLLPWSLNYFFWELEIDFLAGSASTLKMILQESLEEKKTAITLFCFSKNLK